MEKIKVLEVNNIDLPGRTFNGYDLINDIDSNKFDIKQAVIIKQSNNNRVIKLFNNEKLLDMYFKLMSYEEILSTVNVYSITTPALLNLKEYKEAEIIHFHMFHNSRFSLYSLINISKEKKVIISLHDPYFLTGHCVHFYDCNKWKDGCKKCEKLNILFPFQIDNCSEMWKLKKYVFDNSNIDIIVHSKWMYDLVKQSPIFKNVTNIHYFPLGMDINKLNTIKPKEAKKHFDIKNDEIVLFLRAQNEFKGTEYIVEALKTLNVKNKIVVITCDNVGLLDEVKEKYKIIDLGHADIDTMKYAMNACDIFLMPSKGESFGMMAVEAMSCSKPVIVFNNTALPSVTHAPECGYLIKDRDSNDLMKGIKYLIEHPEERIKRGKLARKICIDNYNYDDYLKEIEKIYNDVHNKKINKSINKCLKKIKNNENIKNIFSTIKNNGDLTNCKKDIKYSSVDIQEIISIYNNELYLDIINNKIRIPIKDRIKMIIKRNDFLYRLAKKILGK